MVRIIVFEVPSVYVLLYLAISTIRKTLWLAKFITSGIRMSRMIRRLEGNIGNYPGEGNVATRERCGGD
jgi:hypothetical protein